MTEQEQNRRIAETIYEKFAWDNRQFREGDFVAILDGKVLAIANNPDEVIAALRRLEPDPKRGMVIEVRHPMVDVIR